MARVVAALALLASASAFVPSSPLPKAASRSGATTLSMAVEDMPGVLPPVGFFGARGAPLPSRARARVVVGPRSHVDRAPQTRRACRRR